MYTTEQKYEYVLSHMQKRLEQEGYKRSGKSGVFYRYHADRRVACILGMQKSMDNFSGISAFTFNVGCITIDEIIDAYSEFWEWKLNLSVLKQALRSSLSERIGFICRGYDAWYDVSELELCGTSIEDYYSGIIEPDIEKTIVHIEQVLKNKLKKYKDDQENS